MEPVIYDDEEEGKVTKLQLFSDGSLVIEQYIERTGFTESVVLNKQELKRLYADVFHV